MSGTNVLIRIVLQLLVKKKKKKKKLVKSMAPRGDIRGLLPIYGQHQICIVMVDQRRLKTSEDDYNTLQPRLRF